MLISLVPATVFAAPAENQASSEALTVNAHPIFSDVMENDWFYDAVSYANTNGFFNGTTETTFSPSGTMTRGMFVTVLGRMAGVDTAKYSGYAPFGDVSADSYYAPYVAWAYKSGVTSGTGENIFSPDGLINREQMATFFVRYFEIFDVDYNTGENISTIPADIGNVSSWAQDAVKKLWQQGLLNGDGINFNPRSNASRAETATLCMRTDKAVTSWNSEPVNPPKQDEDSGKKDDKEDNQNKGNRPSYGGGSSGPSTTQKTYYEVSFLMGDGQSVEGVTLPETKVYLENTKISLLPTPYKQDTLFLGWYYDSAMENKVGTDDVLTKNTSLYAKMKATEGVAQAETPTYITVTIPSEEVAGYSFGIKDYQEGCVEYFTHVSNLNSDMPYTMDDTTVVADFNQGETYTIKLSDYSSAVFVVDGIEQNSSIRTFNIITEKKPVENLSLDEKIKYIPVENVSDMTGLAFDGLYSVALASDNGEGSLTSNKYEGSFTYEGDTVISVGDTVAVYAGTRPDQRTSETDNQKIAYIEILSVNGNNYTYVTAEAEDILFTPDVLPVSQSADLDDIENQITVTPADLDFSDSKYAALKLNAQTSVDKGDFIAMYSGEFAEGMTGDIVYARVESIELSDENYVITYTIVTLAELQSSMDLFTTRNEEIQMTSDRIEELEEDMLAQATESGFVEEAARYLTALAIETDGFQELSEDADLDLSSYYIAFEDGTPVDENALELMAVKAEITEQEIKPNIIVGNLTHFEDQRGIRGEIEMKFTVEVGEGDNKLVIELQAIFEQEILFDINVDGEAQWEWFIIPYVDEYKFDANLDIGTYTGIGITATAKTQGEDEEEEGFNWKPATGNKAEEQIINISKQIKELMEKKDEFMGQFQIPTVGIDGEEIDEDEDRPTIVNGGLAEKYADMMENAEEAWIEILKIPIIESTGYLDYLQIMNYSITADFVISANLYVTIGMTFEHSVANRYNFSVKLFERRATNNTINLEENHYQFDFYVMGTMGFRAGVEFELAVGVFTTKLDSVGIEAEAGVYAQMWGYFYFSLGWSQSGGKTTEYSGALAIEVGMYLEIKFKAQAFSSEKLTYDPTIYENEFPFLTIGSIENVYDFAYEEDDEILNIEAESIRTIDVPELLFSMNYMDMKSGEIFGSEGEDEEHLKPISYIDSEKEHFDIEFSNRAFRYDAENNKIIVAPSDKFSINESSTMTITWKKAPLAFTSQSLQRVVNIDWHEVNGVRSYNFLTDNGTVIEPITAMIKAPIEWPEDPVREGYIFKGWKEMNLNYVGGETVYWSDYYTCPEESKMPDDFRGYTYRILVADWEARNDVEYKVEIYRSVSKENPDGTYSSAMELYETKTYNDGTSDQIKTLSTRDAGVYDSAYEAYDLDYPSFYNEQEKVIAPDGSTVFKFYYYLKPVYVSFHIGGYNGKSFDNGTSASTKTYKRNYGEPVIVPKMAYDGYVFLGFNGGTIKPGDEYRLTSIGKHEQLWGEWVPSNDTPYRVIHYVEDKENWGTYLPERIDLKKGTTDTKATYNESDLLKLDGYYLDTEHPDSILKTTITAGGEGTIELYYTRKKYTLTFDFNGVNVIGGDNMYRLDENNQVVVGHNDLAPNIIPQAKGYEFIGWYVKNGKETNDWGYQYLLETRPVSGDAELYARWKKADYTINIVHYKQNPDGTYNESVFEVEEIKIDPDGNPFETGSVVDVSKFVNNIYLRRYEGFEFNSKKYGFATSVNDTVFERLYTIPEDFTEKNLAIIFLYERNTFYFDGFDLNGGRVVSEGSQEGYYRFGQEFKAPVVKRDGYEFKGWSTELSDGAAVDVITTVPSTGIPRYHAIWEPLTTTKYTFNAYFADETGEYDATPSRTETLTGATDSEVKPTDFADRYLDIYGGYEVDVERSTPHRPWTINADGSLVVNVFYKRIERTVTYMVDGKVYHTIKGRWGEAVSSDKLPKDPSKTGAYFAHWAENEAGNGLFGTCKNIPNKDTTVYAIWSVATYSLTWDFAGGYATNLSEYTGAGRHDHGTVIVAPVLERKGHTFNGWNEEISDKLYEDKTYTASWTPWKTTIKFHPNVPEGMERYLKGTMEDQVVVYGEENILNPNTFELTGTAYVPDYWKIKQGRIDLGAKLPDLQIEENGVIDLYMSWKTVPTSYELHIIVQKVDGSYPWSDNPNFVIKKTGEVGEEITLDNWKEVTEVDTTHFTFDSENERSFGTVGATGNSVFYGYYNRNKYPVTWKDGDGNVLLTADWFYESTPVYKGTVKPTKTTDEKYSYTFNGSWKVEGGDIIDSNYKITEPITLIAQFNKTPRIYTVTFDGNGGYIGSSTTYTTKGASGSNSITAPEKSKMYRPEDDQYTYTFTHWTENPDGTGVSFSSGSYEPTSNMTWYAQWNKTVKVFWVYWHDCYGGTVESYGNVPYGTTPEYHGETPVKPEDAQYTYTFKGWAPEVGPITGDTSYHPVFESYEKSLTVIYYDYKGIAFKEATQLYSVATNPENHTKAPAEGKPATEKYYYEFSGYRQDLSELNNGIVKYYAEYKETLATYTITWINYDGTELYSGEFEYGTMPEYKGETPTKEPSNPEYECEFSGWTPELTEVTQNATYTATFMEADVIVDITWVMSGDGWTATAPGYTGNGEDWVVKYRLGDDIVVPELERSVPYDECGYHYVHTGWYISGSGEYNVEIGKAEQDIKYIPIFDRSHYLYNTWVNGVRITSENMNDVLGDGTVSFTGDTLILNNYVFDSDSEYTIIEDNGIKYTSAVFSACPYIQILGETYINVTKESGDDEIIAGMIVKDLGILLNGTRNTEESSGEPSVLDIKGTDYGIYSTHTTTPTIIDICCDYCSVNLSGNKSAINQTFTMMGDFIYISALEYDTFNPDEDTDGPNYLNPHQEYNISSKHLEVLYYRYTIHWHGKEYEEGYPAQYTLPRALEEIVPLTDEVILGTYSDKKVLGWSETPGGTVPVEDFGIAELEFNGTEKHYYAIIVPK